MVFVFATKTPRHQDLNPYHFFVSLCLSGKTDFLNVVSHEWIEKDCSKKQTGKYSIWRQKDKGWTCCWLKDAWLQADSEPVP